MRFSHRRIHWDCESNRRERREYRRREFSSTWEPSRKWSEVKWSEKFGAEQVDNLFCHLFKQSRMHRYTETEHSRCSNSTEEDQAMIGVFPLAFVHPLWKWFFIRHWRREREKRKQKEKRGVINYSINYFHKSLRALSPECILQSWNKYSRKPPVSS